jgi:hypothetical protein
MMRRFSALPALVTGASALVLGAGLLFPAAANAQPAPVGSCPGHFQLLYVAGSPSEYPDAPQHKDTNGDGWLCYNGHAWKDNNKPL